MLMHEYVRQEMEEDEKIRQVEEEKRAILEREKQDAIKSQGYKPVLASQV